MECDDNYAHVAHPGIFGQSSFLARVVLRFLRCAQVGAILERAPQLGMRARSGISMI